MVVTSEHVPVFADMSADYRVLNASAHVSLEVDTDRFFFAISVRGFAIALNLLRHFEKMTQIPETFKFL